MASIKHYLIINALPEKVYKALTSKVGVAGWWTSETFIGVKIGDNNEFNFGETYHNVMTIKDLKLNERVEWYCEIGDKEWVGTKLIFEIEKQDNNSILRFTHGDWKEETDFFASCNFHWGHYMNSLKKYCETGKGMPFQN